MSTDRPTAAPRPDDPYFNCWKCRRAGGTWEWIIGYWVWQVCDLCNGRGEVFFIDPKENQ